jgi:hypothetical protein
MNREHVLATPAVSPDSRFRRWRVKVMHDRVAAIDVHKDMVKVAVRVPGAERGARKRGQAKRTSSTPCTRSSPRWRGPTWACQAVAGRHLVCVPMCAHQVCGTPDA